MHAKRVLAANMQAPPGRAHVTRARGANFKSSSARPRARRVLQASTVELEFRRTIQITVHLVQMVTQVRLVLGNVRLVALASMRTSTPRIWDSIANHVQPVRRLTLKPSFRLVPAAP